MFNRFMKWLVSTWDLDIDANHKPFMASVKQDLNRLEQGKPELNRLYAEAMDFSDIRKEAVSVLDIYNR